MNIKKPLRIGLVVGETSGAILAQGMLKEILQRYPDAVVEGIGSQQLIDMGMNSLFDMNELSVMGLVEVLKHLPRLMHIRKTVIRHFINSPPDVFIGVDAPDFNLTVEKKLKAVGIPTVHYVSPTVWAWREKRIHKIAKATNLVLGVFPFENEIYAKYNIPFKFVGHTMADSIPIEIDKIAAKDALQLRADNLYLALLPGSRKREIDALLNVFIDTYQLLKQKHPNMRIIIPAVNLEREEQIKEMLKDNYPELTDYIISRRPAREVMMASDLVLLASGTAALEAMLCKSPMVVAYKMSGLTYMMMKRLYKPAYFALPNILANKSLVPEFLQEQVNPDNLAHHLEQVMSEEREDLLLDYTAIHNSLAKSADVESSKAILSLIGESQNHDD
ncbi:lipid-A-disaccharide synthase [Glaciecola petra]|uniref:Lipid-A-disaccharide synthase n=1 Tax=Glaciecola petra TaxID=3075602 RepID=A0ABU2ZQH2_9ALTE|nr:lipid-A-disaccharide synthase [Aestuariibacter sp. P117]MDT0593707.1 lipid-A-disaccharide synthase [Aestuariibacter sp. P117]